jgi:hypothetical protein
MFQYAARYLGAHLAKVDLAITDQAVKTRIGPLLIKLFTEEGYINSWWNDEDMLWLLQFGWFYDDDNVDVVMKKWFRDPAVVKNLDTEQAKWLETIISNADPDEDFLIPIAVVMAKRWLQSEDFYPQNVFPIVQGHLSKVTKRKATWS